MFDRHSLVVFTGFALSLSLQDSCLLVVKDIGNGKVECNEQGRQLLLGIYSSCFMIAGEDSLFQ